MSRSEFSGKDPASDIRRPLLHNVPQMSASPIFAISMLKIIASILGDRLYFMGGSFTFEAGAPLTPGELPNLMLFVRLTIQQKTNFIGLISTPRYLLTQSFREAPSNRLRSQDTIGTNKERGTSLQMP